MKKYTKEHEWLEKIEGNRYKVGISDYAQDQLGDVVLVELPAKDASFAIGDDMAVIESVKAASDVYAPVDGKIVALNETLQDEPTLINSSPEKDGWLVEIEVSDNSVLADLMDADSYKKFVAENE